MTNVGVQKKGKIFHLEMIRKEGRSILTMLTEMFDDVAVGAENIVLSYLRLVHIITMLVDLIM